MRISISKLADIETVGDYLDWATDFFNQSKLFYGHGTDNAWDEAVMLVLFVLQLPAEANKSMLISKLNLEQKNKLIDIARQRVATRSPVPYLTNEAWFAGERYIVNKDVLIPRSPLAETIGNHFQPWLGTVQPQRILDLCTGSGCLAVYCAKKFPGCQIDAVDISAAALAVAQQNIALHNCAEQVHIIQSDLFAGVAGNTYDIIISNPPYVSAQDMASLPPEYTHEPSLALASGVDGLDLTLKIIRTAKKHLTPKGLLIVEVGNSWPTLVARLPTAPFVWLEFNRGGEGVFLLTAADLKDIKL